MALAPNCCACSHMRSKASVRACSQRISVDGDVAAEQGLQRTEDVADDRARTNRDSAHHAKTFLDVMAGQIERARNHGFQHVPSWMDVGSISARRPGHSAFVPESFRPSRKPGTPDSATVGRSWTKGERCLLDTASARNLPAFTCCSTFGTLSNIRSTWPP